MCGSSQDKKGEDRYIFLNEISKMEELKNEN